MKKSLFVFGICLLLIGISCQRQDPTFLITETSVGPLNQTNSFQELETLFINDSVVKDTFRLKTNQNPKKVKIFEVTGNPLLSLTANSDSVPTIENVRIEDPRYMTQNGVGLSSSFKDIQNAYDIRKIVTTINSVVVFPKNSNLYFTIDKMELPANLRFTKTNIEAVQIPDDARIKYLMVGWD